MSHRSHRSVLGSVAVCWLALLSVAQAQTAVTSAQDSKPASAAAPGDSKADIKAEAKASASEKKPQVRTYGSVTVVSDPAQVPRLPLPGRPAPEPRENVRALRQEIQELRRSLRHERPEAADVRSAAVPARPETVRPGTASGPVSADEASKHDDRPRPDRAGTERPRHEPRDVLAGPHEREDRQPDGSRLRPPLDGRPRLPR